MVILEYINQWNTELVYLLFLITTLLVFLVFQMQKSENSTVFSVLGIDVTIFHVITLLLTINIILLLWNQLRRKDLEDAVKKLYK